MATRTSPAEPGLLHVARVPAAGTDAAGGEPWPWRRVDREGAEAFSEVAEDVLSRLSYKVMQVMVIDGYPATVGSPFVRLEKHPRLHAQH